MTKLTAQTIIMVIALIVSGVLAFYSIPYWGAVLAVAVLVIM